MEIRVCEIKRGDFVLVGSVYCPLVDARICWIGNTMAVTLYIRDDFARPIPFTYKCGDVIKVFRDE